MQSPSNNSQHSCCGIPAILRSKTFDYHDDEMSFAPALGYITPPQRSITSSHLADSPPPLVLRYYNNNNSTSLFMSETSWDNSSLYIPDPLDQDDDDDNNNDEEDCPARSLSTVLRPRFVSLPVDEMMILRHDEEEQQEHEQNDTAVPCLSSLTNDSSAVENDETMQEEGQDKEMPQDVVACNHHDAMMETAPPMPQPSKPLLFKSPLTATHQLNLAAVRRKSFGAFAA